MSIPTEQFKINLNQNIWGLLVGLSSLGIAEHFHLKTLFWFAVVISSIMLLSVTVTIFAYTINYWKAKFK